MKVSRRFAITTAISAMLAPAVSKVAFGQSGPPQNGDDLPPGLPQPSETIELWPNGAPGLKDSTLEETVTERSKDRLVADRSVSGISNPRMVVFRPKKPNGAALLVTPGGGYKLVVVDKEGYEVARRLAAIGFTVFVLFYRLPGEGWQDGANVPLADAQRAIRLIRHRATEYQLDPERVGAMGFSAGGHLCADLATRFDAPVYQQVDAADALSAMPFLAAPIYPVITMSGEAVHAGSRTRLIGADADEATSDAHSPHKNVPYNAPPFFLLHAEDDAAVPVENTLLLRAALKAKGIEVETHLFAHGGHGFGLRKAIGKPVGVWLDLFLQWARTIGFYSQF